MHPTDLKLFWGKYYITVKSMYELGFKLNYTEAEIQSIVRNSDKLPNYSRNGVKNKHRDNKAIRVGIGGSNQNKIRYPSKKRSRQIWKRFYTLFPKQAEIDNWDSKTSDRM